jgi:hypothetical protein
LALEKLRPTLDQQLHGKTRLERERADVQAEIEHLVAAVATGGTLSGLVEGLRDHEQRRSDLDAQLASLHRQEALLRVDWSEVRARMLGRLTDWRGLLRAHVPQARQLVRKPLVGPIRLTPSAGYRIDTAIGLGRVLAGIIEPTSVASPTGTDTLWTLKRRDRVRAA